jgi:hypothetical protein
VEVVRAFKEAMYTRLHRRYARRPQPVPAAYEYQAPQERRGKAAGHVFELGFHYCFHYRGSHLPKVAITPSEIMHKKNLSAVMLPSKRPNLVIFCRLPRT